MPYKKWWPKYRSNYYFISRSQTSLLEDIACDRFGYRKIIFGIFWSRALHLLSVFLLVSGGFFKGRPHFKAGTFPRKRQLTWQWPLNDSSWRQRPFLFSHFLHGWVAKPVQFMAMYLTRNIQRGIYFSFLDVNCINHGILAWGKNRIKPAKTRVKLRHVDARGDHSRQTLHHLQLEFVNTRMHAC